MINIKDKMQNICNQLSVLLPQFNIINVRNFNSLSKQIEEMTIGENKISQCAARNIQEVTIHDLSGVTSINSYALYNCTNLTDITIPNSVTTIGYSVFEGCESLIDIYLNPTTPPSLSDKNAIPITAQIHVPIGSGDAYKSATNWSYHSSRIVEDIEI